MLSVSRDAGEGKIVNIGILLINISFMNNIIIKYLNRMVVSFYLLIYIYLK